MPYLLLLVILCSPALLLAAQSRWPWMGKIGMVMWCYIVGISMGNLLPNSIMQPAAKLGMEASLPLAIPLLLFATNVRSWYRQAPRALLSFVGCILSVLLSTALLVYLFNDCWRDLPTIAGMLSGIYTGGTANLAAIGLGLQADESLIVLLTTGDTIVGAVYLLGLLSVLPAFFGKILKTKTKLYTSSSPTEAVDAPWNWALAAKSIGMALLAVGMVVAAAIAFTGGMDELFVIVGISIAGILGGLIPYVRQNAMNQRLGNYLLLVFCVAIGSLARVEVIIQAGIDLIFIVSFVVVLTLFFHLLYCKLLGIDRDTFIITSTAGLYGAPFVPMVAKSINNEQIITTGITIALMGYALANFIGIAWAKVLLRLVA